MYCGADSASIIIAMTRLYFYFYFCNLKKNFLMMYTVGHKNGSRPKRFATTSANIDRFR